MPIYAYRCEACGHAKDVLQKISDPVLTVCPSCGAQTFKKQVTAAGFQLKGSGWYVTDFRGGASGAGEPVKVESDAKTEVAKSDAATAVTPAASPAPAASTPAAAPPAASGGSSTGSQ
ncbi:MAG: zinc ribbon domain-containing protein [Cytophagales bacterium]|nr:zinc ribbon domain-containing protein [Rhizobacter sp.]